MKWGLGLTSPILIPAVGDETMAHTGKLSAVEVAKVKGPAVLHDGGGLYPGSSRRRSSYLSERLPEPLRACAFRGQPGLRNFST